MLVTPVLNAKAAAINYFLLDNLVAPGTTPLENHIADIGGQWALIANFNAQMRIGVAVGAQDFTMDSSGWCLYSNPAAPPSADYGAEAPILADVGYSNYQFVTIRQNNGAGKFYGIGVDPVLHQLQLVYSSGLTVLGILDAMAYTPPVLAGPPPDIIRIEAIGTSLVGKLNGVPVLAATDANLAAAGTVGVYGQRTPGQPVYFGAPIRAN